MRNNKLGDCNNCIFDILTLIFLLQENAKCGEIALESCDKSYLGQRAKGVFNTRPVMLYLKGCCNTPLTMPTTRTADEMAPLSNVFRIEKLDDCCCTFRVLELNPDGEGICSYVSTNSFFTINVDCICIIRCLSDTFVEI